ncbi:MAG: MFS transporter [Calditrichaeota bacterium]|nr:MAG: MFS transporter [Calditrichota bacterium]
MSNSEKLFNKDFVLIYQGQFVSRLGSQVFMIAIVLWIKEMTGSASLMGIVGAITSGVAIVLGPFAGTFTDRVSRKHIIVITDTLNGIIMVLFGLAAMLWSERIGLLITIMLTTSILSAVISSFFGTAISAAVPDIVPKDKLPAANSFGMFSQTITSFIGKGIGGILFTVLGAPILFLFNGISFLFSAVSEMFITIPQTIPEKQKLFRDEVKVFKKQVIEGFKYIGNVSGLRNLVIISAVLSFFTTPIIILLPFYVEKYLHLDDQWYGYLLAVYSVGTMLGYFGAALFRYKKISRAFMLISAIILESAMYGVLGFVTSVGLAAVMAFMIGLVSGYTMVNITTILQITTPPELRGRVFGVLSTIEGSLSPIAMALSGIIADLLNQNIPLIYLCSGIIMVLVSSMIALFKDFQSFLKYEVKTAVVRDPAVQK